MTLSQPTLPDVEAGAIDPPVMTENQPEQGPIYIRPSTGWPSLRLAELWQYRELLYFLIWRDIKVRYKQTALGAAWAVLQPVFAMVVFSVFLGRLARVPSDGYPYPLFVYCALVPWTYFAGCLTHASNSLVDHRHLLTRVYFPRLLMPSAAVFGGLVDLGLSLTLLLAMLAYYGVQPGWAVLATPLFILLAAATALAVSLWLAALNVQYRDVRHVIPFLVQFWLFATPVAYSSTLVPERWRVLYGLNPMTGVVEGFRWALLGRASPPGAIVAVSAVTVGLLLIAGVYYFRRMEKGFADVV
jgi:lipopolysaccharide transport system permease protein